MGLQVLCVSLLTFLRGLADLGDNPVQPVIQDSLFWLIFRFLLAAIGFTAQATTTQIYVLEAPDSGRAW
ncbi:MAG: hypothetical protein PVH03_15075 [Chloroflexota bacterium]